MGPRKNRYFTPPEVPKIDLHVASLRGGGACPSQYWGSTSDDREVYIRYRGGNLTIDVASQPGEKARKDDNVLDVQLGPPLDGSISIGQLMTLSGLRVSHRPDHQVSFEERDLSGATTFWETLGLSATKAGAENLLATLWHEFPNFQVSEVSWSHPTGREERPLADGEKPSETLLELTLGSGSPNIFLSYSRFKYDSPGFGRSDADSRHSVEVGREIENVGGFACEVKYENLRISSEFPTEDALSRTWLEQLDRILDTLFPEVEYTAVDLTTGVSVADKPLKTQDDPAICEWVRAKPNRFRYITRRHVGGPLIGYR